MSVYKGGYILADISETSIANTPRDLLPIELKNYLSKYIDEAYGFKTEVLEKPIILIVNDLNDFDIRLSFENIDDEGNLFASVIFGSTSLVFTISCEN